MPGVSDGKMDSLDTHLEQFKLSNHANQTALQGLLKDHSQLLDNYKSLKKAYEAQVANNGVTLEPVQKPRTPYVLVLIDGNGYIFNDEFIRDKEEGGMRAARMLNVAVDDYLRDAIPGARDARVIVRIYADLTNLSRLLAKSKLVGLEKRSLAPFTAGFTRAINHFDFIDALDEEGTKFKIRETFKLAGEDTACTHILYAGCHDTSYLPQMVPYSGMTSKITLVQGAGFNSEFHQFSLNVTQFPTLFRWSELPSTARSVRLSISDTTEPTSSPRKNQTSKQHIYTPPALRNATQWGHDTDPMFSASETFAEGINESGGTNGSWEHKADTKQKTSQTPCRFFQKGFCRFGNSCSYQHIPSSVGVPQQTTNGHGTERKISKSLPSNIAPGFIPINKDSQRIDVLFTPPTQAEWQFYNARFQRQKPCNSYYLQKACTRFNCPYDHSPLEPEALRTLEYLLKCSPCPRRGSCRAAECIYGHLCQKDDCFGEAKGCRMRPELHNVDPNLASLVPAEDDLVHDATPESLIDAW
ncbi:hypothetical protein BDV95DRAFT_487915 [Massariosphaeria phaeospora]|uniref:C3H1-type domain-containing protein n=1 Tax=Massariosphaeria phaeospora TaxID=100035 RepID=A0A7C8IDT7_9PLEO|nr:hypothetical protein BDV95DRAFT_487915 [Massariosphaeria phaeospora]